ncbi:Methyltransferase type 11 domain protein [Rhodopirellula maiorica SM1]|uniref:Methyltransferase type 11 domain protein n=1 Tax=Rhodopirellula maiorica SM1 TaxID=1265738 RepID=M5RUJ6_9BACT|nr:class I SAM-dependent methyltransferase [Rhodopirellula maiorica]EMI17644.1 Methyltransferase type 11 domain protein [Rhodopirellula maiorica SM1]
MRVADTTENVRENEQHYDQSYRDVNVDEIVNVVENFEAFFDDAVRTDTSWYGMYMDGFAERLKGKRVLELGCGNGVNALAMSVLGAQVVAVDISSESARIVNQAAERLGFGRERVQGMSGDFTALNLEEEPFDCIVGKAFLHHLTEELEREYLGKAAGMLKPDGEARFFEPAENSPTLDALRWMVPVRNRPSSLNKKAFANWKASDPHPDRSNSSHTYLKNAGLYFEDVKAISLGSIERFHKLLPGGSFNRKYRRWAHRVDARMPIWFRHKFARSQLLVYRNPKLAVANRDSL